MGGKYVAQKVSILYILLAMILMESVGVIKVQTG